MRHLITIISLSLVFLFVCTPSQLIGQTPGNALSFDGVDDYVDCGMSSSIAFRGETITLEAWINANTWRSYPWEGNIISMEDADQMCGYMLRCGDNGKINFALGNGMWNEFNTDPILVTGRWYHLAAVSNGYFMKIYVDGVLRDSMEFGDSFMEAGVNLMLGTSPAYPSRAFNGMIDEVRIWNIARTQSQIRSTMNVNLAGNESGLKAYYRFNQGTAGANNSGVNTLTDLTSYANTGTLNNFTLSGNMSNWVESYALVQPSTNPATNVTSNSFTANWTAPTCGGTPSTYFLDVDNDSDFSSPLPDYDNLNMGDVTSHSISNLGSGMTYYYRVRAYRNIVTGTGQSSPFTSASTNPALPLSGTVQVGVGQAYTSLTKEGGLFQSINIGGLSGSVTAVITSDLDEDGNHSLQQWYELGTGGYTLTIQPDGTTERVISGNVDSTFGMIRVNGADRIVIDGRFNGSGRYIRLKNTASAAIALAFLNGVYDAVLRNCTLEGNVTWNSEHPALFLIRATRSATSRISVEENIFRNRTDLTAVNSYALDASGSAGISDISICKNNFINTETCILVNSTQGNHWVINDNSFYATTAMYSLSAIMVELNPSSNDTIAGNYIGGQAPYCGGSPVGIDMDLKGIYFHAIDGVNNIIMNNTIQNIDGSKMRTDKKFYGIDFISGGIIKDNIIGHPSDSSKGIVCNMSIASECFSIQSTADSIVRNTISHIYMYTETHLQQKKTLEAPATFIGIRAYEGSSQIVAQNRIYSTEVTGTSSQMHWFGMYFSYTSVTAINNMISFAPPDTTADIYYSSGIYLFAQKGNNVTLAYNSIYLTGKVLEWYHSACISRPEYDSCTLTMKDNILVSNKFGLGYATTITLGTKYGLTSDYNAFYSSSPSILCTYDGGSSYVNFAGWKTGTSQDSHSSNIPVYFVNALEGDLHLTGSSLGNISLAGTPLVGITNDIDDEMRSPTLPYMGADENTTYLLFPSFTITASAGTGGNITPSGDVTVYEGYSQQFIISPNPGYAIDSLLVDGSKVDSTTSYTFNNVTANHTIRAVFIISSEITREYQMLDKWNMVSIPLTVVDYQKTTLFPTATSSAFAYEAGYTAKNTLAKGIAYWLKFSGAQLVSMTGTIRTTDTLDVLAGWNMIGTISEPVAVANIISLTPGLVLSQFFGYNNGYSTTDTLYPAKGYWVKANMDGQIVLSSSVNSHSSLAKIKVVQTTDIPPAPPEDQTSNHKPQTFGLSQNYPNPFNPSTVIRYQVSAEAWVTLKVYNMLGAEVATLVDGIQEAGYKSVDFNANSLPSGVYLYRMTAGNYCEQHKMILMK